MSNTYDPRSRGKNIITPGGNARNPEFARSDISRILPRQLSTGSTRGTQTVGYGNTKIDGSNNRITIASPDGQTVGMGAIPGTSPVEYGFFMLDSSGRVVMKILAQTIFGYDPNNNYVNNVQMIKLTNGDYGAAFSKDGDDLVEALGS